MMFAKPKKNIFGEIFLKENYELTEDQIKIIQVHYPDNYDNVMQKQGTLKELVETIKSIDALLLEGKCELYEKEAILKLKDIVSEKTLEYINDHRLFKIYIFNIIKILKNGVATMPSRDIREHYHTVYKGEDGIKEFFNEIDRLDQISTQANSTTPQSASNQQKKQLVDGSSERQNGSGGGKCDQGHALGITKNFDYVDEYLENKSLPPLKHEVKEFLTNGKVYNDVSLRKALLDTAKILGNSIHHNRKYTMYAEERTIKQNYSFVCQEIERRKDNYGEISKLLKDVLTRHNQALKNLKSTKMLRYIFDFIFRYKIPLMRSIRKDGNLCKDWVNFLVDYLLTEIELIDLNGAEHLKDSFDIPSDENDLRKYIQAQLFDSNPFKNIIKVLCLPFENLEDIVIFTIVQQSYSKFQANPRNNSIGNRFYWDPDPLCDRASYVCLVHKIFIKKTNYPYFEKLASEAEIFHKLFSEHRELVVDGLIPKIRIILENYYSEKKRNQLCSTHWYNQYTMCKPGVPTTALFERLSRGIYLYQEDNQIYAAIIHEKGNNAIRQIVNLTEKDDKAILSDISWPNKQIRQSDIYVSDKFNEELLKLIASCCNPAPIHYDLKDNYYYGYNDKRDNAAVNRDNMLDRLKNKRVVTKNANIFMREMIKTLSIQNCMLTLTLNFYSKNEKSDGNERPDWNIAQLITMWRTSNMVYYKPVYEKNSKGEIQRYFCMRKNQNQFFYHCSVSFCDGSYEIKFSEEPDKEHTNKEDTKPMTASYLRQLFISGFFRREGIMPSEDVLQLQAKFCDLSRITELKQQFSVRELVSKIK